MFSKRAFLWKWMLYLHFLYCAVADAEPSDASSRHFPSTIGNPRITDHPQDGYFARNEPATLNCKAEGSPQPTVTWYKDGQLVETNKENPLSHRMLMDNGQLFFLMVIHSKNGNSDIGKYYCNATNSHGSAISHTANIQIAVLKGDFKEEPMDTTTAVGQTVVFHCKPPRGKPEPKVIWHKNSEILHPNDRIEIQEDGDLVISDVEKKDMGEYVCFAINTGGEKQSKAAQLTVLDIPVFHKLPKDVSVTVGKDAMFYCDVVGDPPIKIQWSKNGGIISYGRARILSDKTLRIDNVEPSDEGVYECTAENAAGSTKASARLVVLSPPSFLIRPKDQVVAKGRTVTLQCVAKGNPPPTVFWRKDSQDNLMFPNRDSGGRISVAEDGTFRIEAVNMTDAGVYTCEALNTKGQVSANAKIKVVADGHFHVPEHDPRPPPIIKIGPQNQTLPANTLGLLRCMVSGDPHPIIRWYKDGRPVAMTEPRFTLLDSGTLQISDLMVQDSGTYTCKAISETGETTRSAYILVDGTGDYTPVRSYAPSSLPDPPTKPVVSDVTDTSVHLSWAPGVQVGPSPVFAFQVEYFGYETMDGWKTASNNVKRESYTVEKLRPNTSYVFMVRAVNIHGAGPPSLLSEPVRTLAQKLDHKNQSGVLSEEDIKRMLSGKVIELTNTQSLNASAISLTWKVLKSDDIIEGFQIEYRHIIDIRRLDYGKVLSVRVPPTLTTYTITGLTSYSWYELCVLGFSHNTKSRCSSPVKVQTAENYTPGPPEDIEIERISDSILSVAWKPPKMEKGHFIVTGYQIYCMSEDKKDNCSITTNGRTRQTVIKRLRDGKDYVIRIAAETHLGKGSWSEAFIYSKGEVYTADSRDASTLKPITNEEPEEIDLFKKPWFLGLLIGTVGVMLWLFLCIFSIWLCKKKKNKKKMKDQRFYTGVPLKADEHNRTMIYPPQYGIKDPQMNFSNDLDLPPELCVLLPHGKKEPEMNEDNIYKMAGDGSFPEMKTFYQKQDVAPYATTALIQKQHLMKQRQQGIEHMFRPINHGYMHYSEGSGDSCQKQPLSVDSNCENSRGSTTDHNHSDNVQSPTSDSGSHTTDENGLLIKEKKKINTRKEAGTPKQVVVNWSDMLPPPPDHPPPSECGEPPLYSEIRSGDEHCSARSPVSPVSFSQLSACSCPNPHTQTPVSNWNMPVYSDNECPRCQSEKLYEPTFCQDAYMKRTYSPRTHLLQNVNLTQNPQNNFSAHPARATPNVIYQYSQPHRSLKSDSVAPHGDRQSSLNRGSHSSHSDDDRSSSVRPCFHAYKINQKTDKDYRFLREKESCPEPAPPYHQCGNDSGMGLEEDGTCMDRRCESAVPSGNIDYLSNSLYRSPNIMSSSTHSGYGRKCESPVSEEADYATESDLEQTTEHSQNWNVSGDQYTDCSSVHSSTCSSGDGTFLTEADFASAVAHAAEMSGLTVVGTTVCDPHNKKKERRHRRPARPVSPGYSTDSNYGSIDVVHRPYPKSDRKKQLIEQGRIRGHQKGNVVEGNMQRSLHSQNSLSGHPADHIPRKIPVDNTAPVYDTPYGRAHYIISSPVSPLTPSRLSSLKCIPPPNGSTDYDKGGYPGHLQQNSAQFIREDVV